MAAFGENLFWERGAAFFRAMPFEMPEEGGHPHYGVNSAMRPRSTRLSVASAALAGQHWPMVGHS